MTVVRNDIVYLPLQRRTRLVRAFAALVRALPDRPGNTRLVYDLNDHLRQDLGMPRLPAGHGALWPPPGAIGKTLM
ncbi:hypothetical protein [Pseudoruegeria sp. HB172150]|uniref:hypothetical protein n=1 Tax=Pseudoruegeria sp. HB172150 TaxID=2721164 RepID=UPI00155746CA|nr:hypothetical protein [Pseudoruegeria sp. HB172150]